VTARGVLSRLVSISDVAGDDDDVRLRKRMGVIGGYATIFAPLGLPAASPTALGWLLAVGFSLYSAGNLLVLARTRRFERYVVALLAVGPAFTLIASELSGGVLTNSAALVWAFLTPAYALLALGPRRATPWYVVFLATLAFAVVIDPLVRGLLAPPPYAIQLVFYAQNIGVPLTIVFLLLRYTDIRRRAAEARSDELLTNAIPPSIATRLRHGEERIAESYPETTVLFTDIVGFTPWAQRTDPARVVELLDDLFSRFDGLALEHGVEKIKTVGDAYMAAVGAPEARPDHAAVALDFAVAQMAAVAAWRVANGIDLHVRTGLASGPVVGGVIGRRRILFDLWGDTVNTAARMESSGVPDRIHIAASTRSRLAEEIGLEMRQVDVKGLGPMTTYLVVAGTESGSIA
jgi:guanylate cyclase